MKKHTLDARETEVLRNIRNFLMEKGYAPSVRDLTKAYDRRVRVLPKRPHLMPPSAAGN